MNESGQSDRFVVPEKQPNKGGAEAPLAEAVEGRNLTKGNSPQHDTRRTQSRDSVQIALEAIPGAAKRDRKTRFTALYHHIYDSQTLWQAYLSINKDASPGVDSETWEHYGENLEENLRDLSERLKKGAYRAKPVKRVYILKPDGKQRPLGITTVEDKIVQKATVLVLNAIYEVDFLGFSYGFRPRRSQHNALDAVYVGLQTRKVNWVLDADVRDFYGSINHEWLIRFIEHRIGDRRVVRLIQKWLKAGVLEEGKMSVAEHGAVQGGSISPLLSNIYLHYVFDLWIHWWRQKYPRGEVLVVRYADDFITMFQDKSDAEWFLRELKDRFKRFSLEIHPEKTRLIEFGRYAIRKRKSRGEGKPQTFRFLGFTHICGIARNGLPVVLRQTDKRKMHAKLKELKAEMRRRMHFPLSDQGQWLKAVVSGHFNYYGVPTNLRALNTFRFRVTRIWLKALRRRSQNDGFTWKRMYKLSEQWLPWAHITQPYPLRRLSVKNLR